MVPGPLTRHIRVNRQALEGLFHLKLKDAAREIGLCSTTFKKACRRFQIDRWPSRGGQRDAADARRNAQTDDIDGAAIIACRETSGLSFSSDASSNATVEAVPVSCSFPSTAASSPTARAASKLPRDYSDPFGAVFSSASCIALGVRTSAFSFDASSSSDPPRKRSCLEAVMSHPHGDFDHYGIYKAAGEQSCLEAVMAYLDGPLAGNFDFMFEDEEAGCEFVG